MADITITAANVVAGSNSQQQDGIAGETIAAGKAVAKDPTTKKWMLADSNSTTAEIRGSAGVGIALNGASNNQPIRVHTSGLITIGATLTPGVALYLSDTPGGICPVADVGTGEYATVLGIAKSTTVLDFKPVYSGVAL